MDFSLWTKNPLTRVLEISQILRQQILWMLLLRIILYTLLLIISFLFEGTQLEIILIPPDQLLLFLVLVYLTTIFSGFFLLVYQGRMQRFGLVQTLIDCFFACLLVALSGASGSSFTTVFFFPIIASGLILPRRGGLLAAASATLLYGGLLMLENSGYYPAFLTSNGQYTPPSPMVSLNQFSIHGLTFFLAAVLSALFGFRLQKAESALSRSLEKFDELTSIYKQIFDNISTGILTVDSSGRITSANNALEEITGYYPSSLPGKNLDDVLPGLDLRGHYLRQTLDFTRVDGRQVRLGYSHMQMTSSQVDDRGQEMLDKIITLRDISEIERLEKQVRQAEKLAAIGMMSASIAHDFRNPLTAISGSAQMLADDFKEQNAEDHTNFELAKIILRESGRLNDTISDFLKFSRPEHIRSDWFSLENCLNEVLQVLQTLPDWPATIKIDLDQVEIPDIYGDEKQIFTVLSHLIQNALPFCPPQNERIAVSAKEVEEDGAMVEIRIEDNGCGIEAQDPQQIFDPFFTTRADGTGLGLAIVKQIVNAHQGVIDVVSLASGEKDGRSGTIFTIRLPLPGG